MTRYWAFCMLSPSWLVLRHLSRRKEKTTHQNKDCSIPRQHQPWTSIQFKRSFLSPFLIECPLRENLLASRFSCLPSRTISPVGHPRSMILRQRSTREMSYLDAAVQGIDTSPSNYISNKEIKLLIDRSKHAVVSAVHTELRSIQSSTDIVCLWMAIQSLNFRLWSSH